MLLSTIMVTFLDLSWCDDRAWKQHSGTRWELIRHMNRSLQLGKLHRCWLCSCREEIEWGRFGEWRQHPVGGWDEDECVDFCQLNGYKTRGHFFSFNKPMWEKEHHYLDISTPSGEGWDKTITLSVKTMQEGNATSCISLSVRLRLAQTHSLKVIHFFIN